MSRYIDADKIEYEDMLYPRGDGNYEECQIAYRDQIDDIPTSDVVEVVRCKDCKYHYSWKDVDDCFYHACERWGDNLGYDADVDVNYFCSFGERAEA